jgi:hypothetical protein
MPAKPGQADLENQGEVLFFMVDAGGGFGKELISCWETGRESNPSAADGNG